MLYGVQSTPKPFNLVRNEGVEAVVVVLILSSRPNRNHCGHLELRPWKPPVSRLAPMDGGEQGLYRSSSTCICLCYILYYRISKCQTKQSLIPIHSSLPSNPRRGTCALSLSIMRRTNPIGTARKHRPKQAKSAVLHRQPRRRFLFFCSPPSASPPWCPPSEDRLFWLSIGFFEFLLAGHGTMRPSVAAPFRGS